MSWPPSVSVVVAATGRQMPKASRPVSTAGSGREPNRTPSNREARSPYGETASAVRRNRNSANNRKSIMAISLGTKAERTLRLLLGLRNS